MGSSVPPERNTSTHDVTRLLHAWNSGEQRASDELLAVIYDDLRRIAREHLAHERHGHTLQPTALVHEAYLRLTDGAAIEWQGRAHFFNLAARAMRRILVDHARSRQANKRGGGQQRIPLDFAPEGELAEKPPGDEIDLVALDAALGKLAADHPRQSRIVELRFFGGLELPDIAGILQVSESTIKRDWQVAKLWLHRELHRDN